MQTENQKLGVNADVNAITHPFTGIMQTETGKEGVPPPLLSPTKPSAHTSAALGLPALLQAKQHDDKKTALIVAGIAAGLAMIYLVS